MVYRGHMRNTPSFRVAVKVFFAHTRPEFVELEASFAKLIESEGIAPRLIDALFDNKRFLLVGLQDLRAD